MNEQNGLKLRMQAGEAAKCGVHRLIWNIDSALTADSLLICKHAGAGARGKGSNRLPREPSLCTHIA